MVLMFHQMLGFPAIICCTGELCTTPLFMPPPTTSFFLPFKRRLIQRDFSFDDLSIFLS